MTVDEALARLDGSDGKPGGCEASTDGLGDIAEVLAAEVERLRGALREIAKHCTDPNLTAYPSRTFDMLRGIAARACGDEPQLEAPPTAFIVR